MEAQEELSVTSAVATAIIDSSNTLANVDSVAVDLGSEAGEDAVRGRDKMTIQTGEIHDNASAVDSSNKFIDLYIDDSPNIMTKSKNSKVSGNTKKSTSIKAKIENKSFDDKAPTIDKLVRAKIESRTIAQSTSLVLKSEATSSAVKIDKTTRRGASSQDDSNINRTTSKSKVSDKPKPAKGPSKESSNVINSGKSKKSNKKNGSSNEINKEVQNTYSTSSVAILTDWVETARDNLSSDAQKPNVEFSENIFDLIPDVSIGANEDANQIEQLATEPEKKRPTRRMFGNIIRAERMKPLLFIWDNKVDSNCEKLATKRLGIAEKLSITDQRPKRVGSMKTEYFDNFKGLQIPTAQDQFKPKPATNEENMKAAADMAEKAMNSLNLLTKADLIEIKAFFKPPKGVDDIFGATMILLAGIHPDIMVDKKGKVKDRSWDACKKQLLKALPDFISYMTDVKTRIDEGSMPVTNMEDIRPLLESDLFSPEEIKKKSKAAYNVCVFVRSIVSYYDIMEAIRQSTSDDSVDKASNINAPSKIGKTKKNSKPEKVVNKCSCWISEHKLNYKSYDPTNYVIPIEVYDEVSEIEKRRAHKLRMMERRASSSKFNSGKSVSVDMSNFTGLSKQPSVRSSRSASTGLTGSKIASSIK